MEPAVQRPTYEELAELVALQAKTIERLTGRVVELEAEVAELRRRLGLNSSNSSRPPSSDGLAKPRREPGRSSGRRRGKQPGSSGSTLEMVIDPDHVVVHRPDRCANAGCGADLAEAAEYARQLRDLKGVHETDPGGQTWAEAMANTLLIAKQATEQAVANGRDALTEQEISFISSCYAGAIAHGRAENPPDRNGELPRAGKLVERFATHRAMILRLVVDLAVPFTNNTAERALRPVKLQQKIFATWRILQGLATFATVRSYLDTAAKHGFDALTVLKQLFTTGPWMPPAPSS